MIGLATKRQVEDNEIANDYKFECVYDYMDEVEELIGLKADKLETELSAQMSSERETVLSVLFGLATALKVTPAALAKAVSTKSMVQYAEDCNTELDKIRAQKTKSVKKSKLTQD